MPRPGVGQRERHRSAVRQMKKSALDPLGARFDVGEDSEAPQVGPRAPGKELAADLGARKPILLEYENAAARHREDRCRRRARGARPDDDRVVLAHRAPVTRSPQGKTRTARAAGTTWRAIACASAVV